MQISRCKSIDWIFILIQCIRGIRKDQAEEIIDKVLMGFVPWMGILLGNLNSAIPSVKDFKVLAVNKPFV